MSIKFRKEIFASNVYYLSKDKEIALVDIEKKLDLTGGYLTKLLKDPTRKNISAEILFGIANCLNVSLDVLNSVEFAKLNDSENRIIGFLEKIKCDSLAGNIIWEIETYIQMQKHEGVLAKYFSQEIGNMVLFKSQFEKRRMNYQCGDSYVAKIDATHYLCLVNVATVEDCQGKDDYVAQYSGCELYIVNEKENKIEKICAYNVSEKHKLDDYIKTFEETISNVANQVVLTDSAMQYMQDFINKK